MLTGNHEFDGIYKKYKNLILKVAYDYSGEYDAAEDIAQDTFFQLYIYFDTMDKKNLVSWLYTTAKHYALNYRKKAEREVFENEEGTENKLELVRESTEEEYMEALLETKRRELHERIFLALLEKNPRWHDAVVFAYYLNIPQAKIAEEMGISLKALHSILHRAKEWIKKEFKAEYNELEN